MKLNRHLIISAAFLALTLLGQPHAWAVEFGIARPAAFGSEQQSYFERTDILQVEAHEHPELNWNNWREAHLEAAAAFLELYPTEHLYFLARDAELLYDAVRLISRDDPQTLARLHLLNVSRANMRAIHLLEYLAQEGITPERLRSDSSFDPIFIDTGFSGTIPHVIAERMPEDVRSRFKTHLLVSSNAKMPSLRAFLYPVNPAISGSSPTRMHGTIMGYEHIARATDRSDTYQQVEGQWHPTSSASIHTDGKVNAETSRQYQEDLRAHLQSEQAIATLQARRLLWRELRATWLTSTQDRWIEYLKTTLSSSAERRTQTELMIRDFLEWTQRIGHSFAPGAPQVLPTLIGLMLETDFPLSNKKKLIAQQSEWAPILENPVTQIPQLLESAQISTLGAILDVIDDYEFWEISTTAIAKRLNLPQVYALAEALIEKLSSENDLALRIFSHPESAHFPELLRRAIEKASPEQMVSFAQYIFNKTHWASQPELFRLTIQKAPAKKVHHLAQVALHRPFWVSHPELLRLSLEKSPADQMLSFAQSIFSTLHWASRSEQLLRFALEKAPANQIRAFGQHAFHSSHWANHPQLQIFRAAVEITDPAQRRAYLFEQLGPYSLETSEQPSLCEQQMLEAVI